MITSCCFGQCQFTVCGTGNRQTSSVGGKNEDTLLVTIMMCLNIPKIQVIPVTGEGLCSLHEDKQLVHREKHIRNERCEEHCLDSYILSVGLGWCTSQQQPQPEWCRAQACRARDHWQY